MGSAPVSIGKFYKNINVILKASQEMKLFRWSFIWSIQLSISLITQYTFYLFAIVFITLPCKMKLIFRVGNTGEGWGQGGHAPPHPLFCIAKRKNGNKGESRKDFKAETIKRLSPRLKCYCFSHSRAPRIQKLFLSANHGNQQYFPVFLGPSTLKSISLGLIF